MSVVVYLEWNYRELARNMFFKLHILTYLRPPAPGIVSDLASYE